ncbi:hypothetical protein EJ03DRAFT_252532, partial [Teratosphaeria nubilosa]
RPLRPPNPTTPLVHQPRRFSRHKQLLLIARTARPQLPYLAQPAFRGTSGGLLGPNPQLARLLSTETRQYVASQVFLAAKWTAVIWTVAFLAGVAYLGIQAEVEERRAPTPEEWTWWSRWSLMGIRQAVRDGGASGVVDWASVGGALRRLLRRLQDAGVDGQGLGPAIGGEAVEGSGEGSGEGSLAARIGKAGPDIGGKSWAWRATYHEVLMSLGRAAEQLDGMVLDTTRGIVFPRAVMIGPSNPDPRPVPAYMSSAPREENCVEAFDSPDPYYMHVITAGGFTTRQRLQAVAAYANWLEYKGRTERVEEVFRWGLDIAKMGLDRNVKPEEVMDEKTFVLKPEAAGQVTENLLTATTNMAIHRARNNDLASALPILLSVLRARRSTPISPFPQPKPTESAPTPSSTLAKIFQPPHFPPSPPSGDLPLIRSSEKPTCEESELMLYIGEILFATSPTASDGGLNWTRQGVAIAEANLQDLNSKSSSSTPESAVKCTQCLHTGLENWETMLRQLSSRT